MPIYLNKNNFVEGYHFVDKVFITDDDYFIILKSNDPTFFWNHTWSTYQDGKVILSIVDRKDRMPEDLINRTVDKIMANYKPPPTKAETEKSYVTDYDRAEVVTTQEWQKDHNRKKQLSGLKRGTYNPNQQ